MAPGWFRLSVVTSASPTNAARRRPRRAPGARPRFVPAPPNTPSGFASNRKAKRGRQRRHGLEQFRSWLDQNGAEILEPTNPFELLRFKAGDHGVGVVYCNAHGSITAYTGAAEAAFKAFRCGNRWSAGVGTKRKPMGHKQRAIRARDGDACFYCGGKVAPPGEEQSPPRRANVEHLVNRVHGGPNHLSNLFLSHVGCNEDAGTESAVEKIRRRERIQGRTPPLVRSDITLSIPPNPDLYSRAIIFEEPTI
jgi:hypothetical protein